MAKWARGPTWTIVTIMQRTHTTERRNQILPLRFGTNQNIEQNVMLSNLDNLSRMGKYRHLCQELNTAKSVGRVILQTNIFIISSLTHIHSSRLSHFMVHEQSSSFQQYQAPLNQQNSICFSLASFQLILVSSFTSLDFVRNFKDQPVYSIH